MIPPNRSLADHTATRRTDRATDPLLRYANGTPTRLPLAES